jgi:GNAT superfamily N-acetyltransferase
LALDFDIVPSNAAAGGSDHNLVLSSWMHQTLMGSGHRAVVEWLLDQWGTIVAVHPEHREQIFGWLCGGINEDQEPVLHMVYVRNAWRQQGVGAALMKKLTPALGDKRVWLTHEPRASRKHPKAWEGLVSSWGLVYNPYKVLKL